MLKNILSPPTTKKKIWLHTYLTTTSVSISSICDTVLTTHCQILRGKKTKQKKILASF